MGRNILEINRDVNVEQNINFLKNSLFGIFIPARFLLAKAPLDFLNFLQFY